MGGRDWGDHYWGPDADTNLNESQADGHVDINPDNWGLEQDLENEYYRDYTPSELEDDTINELISRVYDLWLELQRRGVIP